MSEKLTREELKKDQFLEAVMTAAAWARSNVLFTSLAALGVVLLVMLAVRVAGRAAGTQGVDENAERALATARSEFARSGLEAGIPALESVRTEHRRSRAAREATFLLANSYFEAGDFVKARATYEEFLKTPLYSDLLQDGARLGIAACQEESGDLSGAAAGYLRVWNEGHAPATKLQAALSAARCLQAEGKRAEVIDLLRKASEGYPKAPETEEAKFQLARLEALPGN